MAIVDEEGLLRAVELAAEEAERRRRAAQSKFLAPTKSSQEASQRGWSVALSNPCFEIWLLLPTSNDLASVTDHGDSVEAALRSELGSYDKRHTPTLCLNSEALSQAMAWARRGDTEPANPLPNLPGTQLYKLFESIFRSQAPKQHA